MIQHRRRILVVEPELGLRRFLHSTFDATSYSISEVPSGAEALKRFSTAAPDVLITELNLDDIDGLELVQKAREQLEGHILVLSNRSNEYDRVAALDAGADDFVTKPFGVAELLARIRAGIRKLERLHNSPRRPTLELGEWQIDFANFTTHRGSREIHLTPTEYKLLGVLVARQGRAVSHKELLHAVWGPSSCEQLEYLRNYMRALRTKLEAQPSQPRYLLTVPHIGYRLRLDA